MPISNKGPVFTKYDIAIIGASLSGSSLALQLAPQNLRIALIDSDTFPRRKTCGEGLSAAGARILRDLGVPIENHEQSALSGYQIHWKERVASIPLLPVDGVFAAGVDRGTLDFTILQRLAHSYGEQVTFHFGSAVRSCEQKSESCLLELANGQRIEAKYVIAANGGGRRFGPERKKRKALSRYAFSQHMSLLPGSRTIDHVHIFLRSKYEIYVTPLSGQRINVALMAKKAVFKTLLTEAAHNELINFLQVQLDSKLVPISDILSTGPVGNFQHLEFDGRMFFVGDACEQFDPIGGMGMTHALSSAKILSGCLVDLVQGRSTLAQVAARYKTEREASAKLLRGFTRLTYFMLVALNSTRLSRSLGCSPIAPWVSAGLHPYKNCISSKLSHKFIELVGT